VSENALPASVTNAALDLRRALLAVCQARERLLFELPEQMRRDIDWRGYSALVPNEYEPIRKLIMESKQGRGL
jgi:hypothetical protein